MPEVTLNQRQIGWNVVLSTKSGEVTRELDLCYKFEEPDNTGTRQPALIALANAYMSILLDKTDRSPFPTPWPLNLTAEYIYAFHDPLRCNHRNKKHSLKDTCIWPASPPRRRDDLRYLPIGKTSDGLLRIVSVSRRNLQYSDPASLFSSLGLSSTEGGDKSNDGTFPDAIIRREEARRIIDNFRRCVIAAGGSCCAISKKGKPWWYGGQPIGSTIQPTHIIPQIHWSKYPNCDDTNVAGLRHAWYRTWQVSNGLLLASNLRECFDARLLSIDPDTNLIRAFVPFDMITQFHNTVALIPGHVDRQALRHHYDMCCIENMTAIEDLPLPGRVGPVFAIELPPPSSEPQSGSGRRRVWRLGGVAVTNPDLAKGLKQAGWLIDELRNDNEDEERRGLERW